MPLPRFPGMSEAEEKKDDRTEEEKKQDSIRKGLQDATERQKLIWMEYSASRLDIGDWVRMDKFSPESEAEKELNDREQQTLGSLTSHRMQTRLLQPGFYRNTKTGETVRLRKDLSVIALPVSPATDLDVLKTAFSSISKLDAMAEARYERQIGFLASGRGSGFVKVNWKNPESVTDKYLTKIMEAAEKKFATVQFGENVYKFFEKHPELIKKFEDWQKRLIDKREAHLKSPEYKLYEQEFDFKLSNRALNLNPKLTTEAATKLSETVDKLSGDERINAIDANLKAVEARSGTLEYEKGHFEASINEQVKRLEEIEDLLKKDVDEDQLRQLTTELEKIRESINAHNAERSKLFTNLEKESTDLNKQLEIWKKAIEGGTGALEEDKKKYDTAKQDVDKLKVEVDKLDKEVKKGIEENKVFEKDVNQLKTELADLGEKIQIAQDAYIKALESGADNAGDLQKKRQDLELEQVKKSAQLTTKMEDVGKGVNLHARQTELAQKQKELAEKTAKLNEQKQKFEPVEKRYQETHKNYEALQKKVTAMDFKPIEEKLKNIPGRINEAQAQIETKKLDLSNKAKP